ncbi:MAG TPA: alpha/beta fold hydrolase [Planktothrix sp.]|jgi:carboxylesterase
MNGSKASSTINPDVRTGVLLLHGLTGMPSEMRPVQKYLTQMGCVVESPLLPGHGAGHKELLATTWQDWVSGAKNALDELSTKCDHVVIGGLSMGALLSAMAAVDNAKVSGIIMMSTTLKYDGRASSPLQVFLPLVDLWPRVIGEMFWWTEEPPYGLRDERLQKQITKQVEAAKRGEATDFGLFRTYCGSLRQLHKLVNQFKKHAHRIECPALVIHSLEDSMTTHKNAIAVCKLLNTNDKSVFFVSGCDHVLTLDLRRKDVARSIGQFVIEQSYKVSPKSSRVDSAPVTV